MVEEYEKAIGLLEGVMASLHAEGRVLELERLAGLIDAVATAVRWSKNSAVMEGAGNEDGARHWLDLAMSQMDYVDSQTGLIFPERHG